MQKYTPEQIAAQESKNYNDFVYQTNQSLQNLKFALDDLKKSYESHIAKVQSDRVYFKSDLEELTEKFTKTLNSISETLIKHISNTDKEFSDHIELFSLVEENFFTKSDFAEHAQHSSQKLMTFQTELNQIRQNFEAALERIRSENAANIEKLRSEIVNRPSEIAPVKRSLEDQMKLISMDMSNTVIRSSNCEKRLDLFDKKLEQVNLIIKQIQLSKE